MRIHAIQSHCQASLHCLAALVLAAPWWFCRTIQFGYVSPLPSSNHLSSSIRCRPKPQASIADPFWRLCFCFGMGFGVYVCVLEWILGCVCVSVWVSAFVFVFRRGFQARFRALHFGFVFQAWVSASLCILSWVFAGCSQFVGFDLGCSYFYSFFWFFLSGFC